MTYFEDLGKAMAAEIARNPSANARIRQAANSALRGHLSQPMARDGMPNFLRPGGGRDQAPNGHGYMGGDGYAWRGKGQDQDPEDPNGEGSPMMTPELCMALITKCLNGLDGDEHEKLLNMLADFFQSDPTQGGNGSTSAVNGSAMDRNRRRGGRDTGMRPPAQDAALAQKSFDSRWGKLTANITTMGIR